MCVYILTDTPACVFYISVHTHAPHLWCQQRILPIWILCDSESRERTNNWKGEKRRLWEVLLKIRKWIPFNVLWKLKVKIRIPFYLLLSSWTPLRIPLRTKTMSCGPLLTFRIIQKLHQQMVLTRSLLFRHVSLSQRASSFSALNVCLFNGNILWMGTFSTVKSYVSVK